MEIHTGEVLEGHIEIDGAYFGGHIRPHNEKAKRVDRRLKKHQTGKRRVVIAMREREGRTLPFVGMSEGEGVALANENVSRMSTMSADEASHWDELHKPNMGMVALGNQRPTKADAQIAKNYCPSEELRQMELIGEAFLLFVEGLAERDKQVSMARLLAKFRDVVAFYEYPVFPGYNYPRPTAAQAKKHAAAQYELFKDRAAQITGR